MSEGSTQNDSSPRDRSSSTESKRQTIPLTNARTSSVEEQKPTRVRKWIGIVLAILLGLVGAAIGYKAVAPKYESTAALQIAPYLPKVLYETEQNDVLPMYDSYVQTQMWLIQSRRVIEQAVNSETWKYAGGDNRGAAIAEFSRGVRVVRPENTQLMLVTCASREPYLAQAMTKSLVDAYLDLYGDRERDIPVMRRDSLEQFIVDLNAVLKENEAKIAAIAQEYGSTSLIDAFYAHELQRLLKAQDEREEAKFKLAAAESGDDPNGDTRQSKEELDRLQKRIDSSGPRVLELSNSQEAISRYQEERRRIQDNLNLAKQRVTQLEIEQGVPGIRRISVLNEAEGPIEPVNGAQRIQCAALGGAVGAIAGLVVGRRGGGRRKYS